MALFGRKANQSSSNGDVPPELKPYYVAGSGTPPSRRSALRLVLSLLILAILVTGGISIWRYAHNRAKPASTNTVATNQTTQKPKTDTNTQSQGSNNNTTKNNSSSSGSGGQSPSQQAPSVTQSLPSDNNNPSTATPSTTPSGSTGTGSNSQALVNTGPGETAALIAVVAAVGGALLHYVRQLRRANS